MNGYVEKPAAKKKEPSKFERFFDYASNISTGFLKSQAELRKAQIEQQYKMQEAKQTAGFKFLQAQMEEQEAMKRVKEQQRLITQRQKAEAERRRTEAIAKEERELKARTDEDILAETRAIQNKAMELGSSLAISSKLPPRQQLQEARLLFARRFGETSPKPAQPTSFPQQQKVESIRADLNRGSYTGTRYGEVVDFPIKDLDMSKYMSEYSDKDGVYDLYGVIMHHGQMSFGHYTAFTKNSINGEWYLFDDSNVLHIKPEQVEKALKNHAAYVLFYKKQGEYEITPSLTE